MELLLLAPIAVLAYLLWRADRRYEDAQAAHAAERKEWGTERRQLLNRIQQPEKAVYEDFEPSLEKAYVGHDDDDAYWEAVSNGNDH